MKELKFRVWAIKEKRMYGIYDMYNDRQTMMVQTGAPLHIAPISYFFFLQYTGARDNHNVEVYEDDLLMNDRGIIYKASWSEETCAYILSLVTDSDSALFEIEIDRLEMSRFRLIGNIHENPELVGKT